MSVWSAMYRHSCCYLCICVDECVENPCLYGVTCTYIVVVICVDECAENPCLYGGTRTDIVVVIC